MSAGITLGASVGSYSFADSTAEDYSHFTLSISKADFTFAIEKNDLTNSGAGEDNPRVTVSWSQSF